MSEENKKKLSADEALAESLTKPAEEGELSDGDLDAVSGGQMKHTVTRTVYKKNQSVKIKLL